jgi:hypothetical protein
MLPSVGYSIGRIWEIRNELGISGGINIENGQFEE